MTISEATFLFRGCRVWYRDVDGDPDRERPPILVAHGGPGATHRYLAPLARLAGSGRRVIFWDQIGCGNSEGPKDPSFYDVPLFVAEIDALRAALSLDCVHLLGQSWGGMLAMEYALTQPKGLRSIVVANSPADLGQWVAEANRLRAMLPSDVQATLLAHEAGGTTDDPAYAAAVDAFYRRHVCRVDPYPQAFVDTLNAIAANPFVYHTMNGPSEFHVIGTLKGWSIVDRLGEIAVPTLLLSGAHDEATPAIVGTIAARIPRSEWILFDESSHMPHLEEPQAFDAAVRGFLAGVDACR